MPSMTFSPLHADFEPNKPLPHLPMTMPASPTLTNPDMVLPDVGLPFVASPPRRPAWSPSANGLRDHRHRDHHHDHERPASASPRATMGRKEKLGLMSRKMMLLRSRTNSTGPATGRLSPAPAPQGHAPFIPVATPILQDVGNLAPERPDHDLLQLPVDRRPSGSGSSSSDLSALNGFLAKYTQAGAASDDDEEAYETETSRRPSGSLDIEEDLEVQRRIQEEEEYNSAILSQRAEKILANAKRRLNVMEGNLRGARDLVAPLTAANLKRATSLGSSHHNPAYPRRRDSLGPDFDHQAQAPLRMLYAQASSPAIGRDYLGHARVSSEHEIPERPYTSLDCPPNMSYRNSRAPIRAAEPSWINGLRGSRSYDNLGNAAPGYGSTRERQLHSRGSPDSYPLAPLPEAEELKNRGSRIDDNEPANTGLGIEERPSSRGSDLREQMSSLRGKISTLKERAREESLRRQSASQLRTTSPFNNALVSAPEFFYTSSSNYGSPVRDTNAGVGSRSNNDSPVTPKSAEPSWDSRPATAVTRNAFAEQAARDARAHHSPGTNARGLRTPDSQDQTRPAKRNEALAHARTQSGTAIIKSARVRYSHHQYTTSGSSQATMPGTYVDEESLLHVPPPALDDDMDDAISVSSDVMPNGDVDDDGPEDDETSIYEDAEEDAQPVQQPVVAHEDRDDAFDYEHFFLHSSMGGTYSKLRRGSVSSETSVSSGQTARGPAQTAESEAQDYKYDEDGENDEYDAASGFFVPSSPETPERLKAIEHDLHKRAFSSGSVSTLATFATADEDQDAPPPSAEPVLPAIRPASRSSRPASRPGTALKRPALVRRDSSSERADSGVGLGRHSIGSDGKRPAPRALTPRLGGSTTTAAATPPGHVGTPPMSPHVAADPAAVAVSALLDPAGPPLGLRDKALLFSVVESLRKAVRQMQDEDDEPPPQQQHARSESRHVWRRRLEEVKSVLDRRESP